MKVFDCCDNRLNRSDNNISALYEDKNRMLWVGTDNGVFLFNYLNEQFSFFDKKSDTGICIYDWVADIKADADDNIWMVIPNQGLFMYNLQSEKLLHFQFADNHLPNKGTPECICIEENGRVWVGTNGNGIFLYNKEKGAFDQYLGDANGDSLKEKYIFTLCDYGDKLVVGLHEGKLQKFNKRRNTLQDVESPQVHYKIIRHVIAFENELWVGTQNGIYVIDEQKHTVVNIKEDLMDHKSLSDNIIEKIYKDSEGGIWIGTLYGGVNYLPPKSMQFDRFVPLSLQNSISSKKVNSLQEDINGNIWIASENSKIDIYNPQNGTFKQFKTNLFPKENRIVCLFVDYNRIYVGYFKNGIDIISLPDMHIKHYSGEELGLNESSIYAIYKDKFDRLWLGNGWHIFIENKKNKRFELQPQFGSNFVYDIVEDSEGLIWVATIGNGVYRHNPETNETLHFLHDNNDTSSLSSNSVSSIFVDSSGKIWFSTDRGGICRYNKDENNFTSYSLKDGLPDDVVYKILEDKFHNLWFGTNNGLVKFNSQTKEIQVFKQNQGLPGNQFLYKSALVSSSGKFYFGGVDGLVAFDPHQVNKNACIPPVFISKLTILNKEAQIADKYSPLNQSILHTHDIVLSYDQSNIGFDFVALSYVAPNLNEYAYKLDGIDSEWVYTKKRQVSYAKLPPGKYTFRVKACNNDGLWNETGTYINIRLLPPWWLSNATIGIYICFFLLSAGYGLYWYNKKQKRVQIEKQRLFETEKEKELYSAKVDFFTCIAHEIRTPITLINGPLESILEMHIENPEVNKNLQIMEKNTSELLTLINQLLDFKKVDANKFNLTFKMIDMTELVRNIYSRFEAAAAKQGKIIELRSPDWKFLLPMDKEAVTKILNNLFSNAVSYSKEHITVELTKRDERCIVRISNDGEIIPQEQSERIFAPFYQLKQNKNKESSSGIGLSLARSLAELHHGNLFLEYNSETNVFVFQLPLQQSEYKEEITINDEFMVDALSENTDKTHFPETVLFVEDNVELLHFLLNKFKNSYEVLGATNGKEVFRIIDEKKVDLIISDIMMPEIDGLELCKMIKTNIEYSHIPVILLTAKNDLANKIKGLEAGADAYIEKPFSFNYLISQVSSLLLNRRREKEAFIQKPFLAIQQMGMTKVDEEFIEHLINIIHKNITNQNFGVENLAEQVHISRSTLYRKIKVLSGLSPVNFIRLIRLKKAAEIIQEGRYNIGEVGFLVGINSVTYFTKMFHKQFKMTPKEFKSGFCS
jgi:signal transduction histidine kinase/ligand-binding sensor domain-containing protein/DNA-binding response OmpR family regulator